MKPVGVLSEFYKHLEVEQLRSRHTVDAYRRDIERFGCWLRGDKSIATDADYLTVTTADIRAWLAHEADAGKSAATLRRNTQSLRALYHWARKCNLIEKNPASDVMLAKLRKHLPGVVREREMEELLAPGLSTEDKIAAQRTQMALTMMYSLGLRQEELLNLRDTDINFSSLEIKITGKRKKQRLLPIPAALADEIKEWQAMRDAAYPELCEPRPLIAGPHGPLSKSALYKNVHTALEQTNVARKSPHTLRHSFATAMLADGCDLDALREMLGHASLATTQGYTHLTTRQLLDNYRRAHPRTKKDGDI